jgi:hypothetical protein
MILANTFGFLLVVGATFGPPILLTLAWKGWRRSNHNQQRRWRSLLGLTAIIVIFVDWVGFALLELLIKANVSTPLYASDWEFTNILAAIAGTLAALTLPAMSRIQTVVAGCLMTAIWVSSFIVT